MSDPVGIIGTGRLGQAMAGTAMRSGVNGTPTYYINGVRHDDSYEPTVLLDALERAAVGQP